MADLLVAGDCNPDLVLVGGDVVPEFGQRERLVEHAVLTIGGSAAIAACGAARLGLETAFVSRVGDDLFGRFMLEGLEARGVDISGCVVDRSLPTGLTVALVRDDDRAILTSPGTIRALTAGDIDRRLLRSARHLHIASWFLLDGLRPDGARLLGDAHGAGLTVSIDPQGDPRGEWDGGLRELASAIDVLFVNADEHAAIEHAGCPLVVVKEGRHGAFARAGEEVVRASAPQVDAVDATGAGDSFDAGFLAGWLAGEPLASALALGCACGALSTRTAGGTGAQPTLAEARRAAV